MSNVNSLSTNQYYQLPTSTSSGQSQTGSTGTSASALESELESLLSSNQTSNTGNVSDTVDLSPEAQNILSGLNTGTTGSAYPSLANILNGLDTNTTGSGYASSDNSLSGLDTGTTGSGYTTSASNASFTLSPAQQQKITQVLSKFAGQPMTQATYDQIQNALNAAGVGPQQLSEEDSVQSFNATQDLIDALDGINDPITTPSADSSTEQTKSANYMAQIVSEWQNMSGQTASSASTGVAATGSTATS